jgi:hypothetical protein
MGGMESKIAKIAKVIKVATLAVSAELVGNDHESIAAGARAGALAKAHGMSLDDLAALVSWGRGPKGECLNDAWRAAVDGYFGYC